METYHYIGIAVLIVLLVGVTIVLLRKPKMKRKEYELPTILELLEKDNIEAIDFVRNKIVLTFKDVTKFDTNTLHDKGAKGISIVGDKVKFYFDGDNNLNEQLFIQIQKYIEG